MLKKGSVEITFVGLNCSDFILDNGLRQDKIGQTENNEAC